MSMTPADFDVGAAVHALFETTMQLASDALEQAPSPSDLPSDHSMMEPMEPEIVAESLSVVGHDLLLFLALSVVVEPLAKIVGVTPVLLYLILGFAAGPYGFSLFQSGTEANSEIGDFGILFLLFIEGLNLSPERLKALGSFFSLGATQLLLSVGSIFFVFFFGGPYLLPIVQDVHVPVDPQIFALLEKPVIAFAIAAAGALSSSAFVLPILKEKGWEKSADGTAALSILLLQDLAVAPLLVILPLIAGGNAAQDPAALSLLAAKATLGFGVLLAAASVVLRKIFQLVASYGSSQSFVAASLLVAIGMGLVADDFFGLSESTGAFAAGVLLAESGYRAQIEADIKPFEGILLGVFFVTAGASLDPQTVINNWPTLLTGVSAFILIKSAIVFSAGSFGLGLTRAGAARVALLLAGGGEFAFIIFKLAENLNVLTPDLAKLLTASVVISMSLTPLLGEVADWVGKLLDGEGTMDENGVAATSGDKNYDVNLTDEERIREAFEVFDVDGNGSITVEELQQILTRPGTTDAKMSLAEVKAAIAQYDMNGDGMLQFDEFAAMWTAKRRTALGESIDENVLPSLENAVVICGYGEVGQELCRCLMNGGIRHVAFSRNPQRISQGVLNGARVVYGDGASPSLIKASGVTKPSAFVVVYESESRSLEATLRLRDAFPRVPIYVRAKRKERINALMGAGATEVVLETVETAEGLSILASSPDSMTAMLEAATLARGVERLDFSKRQLLQLAEETGKSAEELIELYEMFTTSLERNDKGEVQLAELRDELLRRRSEPMDDESLKRWVGYDEFLTKWVTEKEETQWVTFPEFVRFSAKLETTDS